MSKPFSLEASMKELEAIEAYFQDPEMKLDDAIEKHKQALELATKINDYLDTAETTIQKIDMAQKTKES